MSLTTLTGEETNGDFQAVHRGFQRTSASSATFAFPGFGRISTELTCSGCPSTRGASRGFTRSNQFQYAVSSIGESKGQSRRLLRTRRTYESTADPNPPVAHVAPGVQHRTDDVDHLLHGAVGECGRNRLSSKCGVGNRHWGAVDAFDLAQPCLTALLKGEEGTDPRGYRRRCHSRRAGNRSVVNGALLAGGDVDALALRAERDLSFNDAQLELVRVRGKLETSAEHAGVAGGVWTRSGY